MELSDYVMTLRRYWIAIVVIIVLGAASGFAVARGSTPMYKASSSVFVSATSGNSTSELVQGSTYAQNLIQSYAALAQAPSVLNPVIDKLGLNETAADLAKSVSADAPLNTVIIQIRVVDESPEAAAKIANAVSISLATAAQALSPKRSDNSPAISMKPIATAEAPAVPYAPNTSLTILIWAAGAMILFIALLLARRMFDTTIRTERDLARAAGPALLGTVPEVKGFRKSGSAALLVSSGLLGDVFRRLADRVVYSNAGGTVRSLVVTSPLVDEGKTTVALSLALALSERGGKVLLIDADLRRAQASAVCGYAGQPGLAEVVAGTSEFHQVVRRWTVIDVLPAGTPEVDPSRLFNSDGMTGLVEALKREYDFVVCDAAAVLSVAETFPLVRLTDGAVLVVKLDKTRREDVHEAVAAIVAVEGTVLGTVLNRTAAMHIRRHRYSRQQAGNPRHTRAVPDEIGTAKGAGDEVRTNAGP